MSRTCLVSVFGPQNVIPLLAAVKYYGTVKQDYSIPNVITVIHNPGLSDGVIKECGDIIYQMIKPFGWAPPVILNSVDVDMIIRHAFWKGSECMYAEFRKAVGGDQVDEVYFTHNLVGKVTDLCIQAYPTAERIITGDGIGQIYDNEYLSFLNQKGVQSLKGEVLVAINKIKKNTSKPVPTSLGSETKIIAILPTDWNGKFSSDKKLITIPRSVVKEIIDTCSQEQTTLIRYCKNMIEQSKPPRFILVLNNFSDGGFMHFDAEVAMHTEIIRAYIPSGSTIFIKPHPFSMSPLAEGVINHTANSYNMQILPTEFKKYPLELMQPIFEHSQVIAFSTTILTLTYLYEKNVINPMNENLMKKYFPANTWNLIEDTQKLFTGSIHNLAKWDGKSILWSGANK
jgi:hypothetical protein